MSIRQSPKTHQNDKSAYLPITQRTPDMADLEMFLLSQWRSPLFCIKAKPMSAVNVEECGYQELQDPMHSLCESRTNIRSSSVRNSAVAGRSAIATAIARFDSKKNKEMNGKKLKIGKRKEEGKKGRHQSKKKGLGAGFAHFTNTFKNIGVGGESR